MTSTQRLNYHSISRLHLLATAVCMYHVKETGGAPWFSGPEIQIQDNEKGHDPQKCGWLYQLYKAEVDATKPAGHGTHCA